LEKVLDFKTRKLCWACAWRAVQGYDF